MVIRYKYIVLLAIAWICLPQATKTYAQQSNSDSTDYVITPDYVPPYYDGGFDAIIQHLEKIRFHHAPWSIQDNIDNIRGEVRLSIIEDGSVGYVDFSCFPYDEPSLIMEVEQALMHLPGWKPALEKGVPVKKDINFHFQFTFSGGYMLIQHVDSYQTSNNKKINTGTKIAIIGTIVGLFFLKFVGS